MTLYTSKVVAQWLCLTERRVISSRISSMACFGRDCGGEAGPL
jgi:hypothetical protein